MHFVDFNHLQL